MSEWNNNLEQVASELSEARKLRDNVISEAAEIHETTRLEIGARVSDLGIEILLNDMNDQLLEGSGTVSLSRSWDSATQTDRNEADDEDEEDDDLKDSDFISCLLEWEENGDRELAVDLGKDDSGLYLEVNGHEISIDENSLQAALLYAIKEELEFV